MALKHATTLAVAVERERTTAVRTAERQELSSQIFHQLACELFSNLKLAAYAGRKEKLRHSDLCSEAVSACFSLPPHHTHHCAAAPHCTTPLLRCAPPAHCTSSPPSFSHRPKIPQCIRCFSQLFPYIYVDMRVGRRPVLAKHLLNTLVGISARCFEKITSPKIFWHLVKFT